MITYRGCTWALALHAFLWISAKAQILRVSSPCDLFMDLLRSSGARPSRGTLAVPLCKPGPFSESK
jgi:hypothetical protein